MSRCHLAIAVVLPMLLPTGAASAQSYDFTASLLGGVGTAADATPDPGISNPTLQLGFSFLTERRTLVGFRLGQMDFGSELVEDLTDSDLTYLTVAGEYRINEGYYESGVYLGLGLYDFSGRRLAGGDAGTSGLGLALGLTGDFTVSARFSVLIEFAFHYADLDTTSAFVNGMVGVGYNF